MGEWDLVLTLRSRYGSERYEQRLALADTVAREVVRVDPPRSVMDYCLMSGVEEVVSLLRRKEFRKDLLRREATRLGVLLAERMEDAEGWHDESRVEKAKKDLQSG